MSLFDKFESRGSYDDGARYWKFNIKPTLFGRVSRVTIEPGTFRNEIHLKVLTLEGASMIVKAKSKLCLALCVPAGVWWGTFRDEPTHLQDNDTEGCYDNSRYQKGVEKLTEFWEHRSVCLVFTGEEEKVHAETGETYTSQGFEAFRLNDGDALESFRRDFLEEHPQFAPMPNIDDDL